MGPHGRGTYEKKNISSRLLPHSATKSPLIARWLNTRLSNPERKYDIKIMTCYRYGLGRIKYLIVPFWCASAAYRVYLVSPTNEPWLDQTCLIRRQSGPNGTHCLNPRNLSRLTVAFNIALILLLLQGFMETKVCCNRFHVKLAGFSEWFSHYG